MLRASLRALGGTALLDMAGIDGQRRPESLTLDEFCVLARTLKHQRG
jgi:16S rRNA (adenine1518-N6/adenine1519-N6)-dimethyltransferase